MKRRISNVREIPRNGKTVVAHDGRVLWQWQEKDGEIVRAWFDMY